MDSSTNAFLLQLAIAIPLFAALVMALGLPKRFAPKLAAFAFSVPAAIALWLWWQFPSVDGAIYNYTSNFDTGLEERFGISLKLGLNGVSMPMFVLAAVVGFAAGLYALCSEAERLKLYLLLLLVMQGGLMGTFSSINIFYFYFFHELVLIPTFIMISIWGGRDRNYAVMKITIYMMLGAMLSLLGLIAIYAKSGVQSFDLIALREELTANPLSITAQKYIFGLLFFGFGTLVPLWPFHTWAPLGYGAAPSSAAMLHAGVLKKFGLYGFIQIAMPLLPVGAQMWTWKLAILAAVGNVLTIGLVTLAQRDLKQMIGYSSIMHMGYCFLGIATLSVVGAGGVVLLMVAHGLSVALMFLLATSIHHRTHTLDMTEMGGLAQKTPVLAAFFVAATMAGIGLPGFANFWGELIIFVSVWPFSRWIAVIAVFGVVISAIYGLRSTARVFFGPPTESLAKVTAEHPLTDLEWPERIPALALLAMLLVIGFWPRSISDGVNCALLPAVVQTASLSVQH